MKIVKHIDIGRGETEVVTIVDAPLLRFDLTADGGIDIILVSDHEPSLKKVIVRVESDDVDMLTLMVEEYYDENKKGW